MDISISLTPELLAFVTAKVESGRYGSTSDVVREALLLLDSAEPLDADGMDVLRRSSHEGLDSGDAGELEFAALRKTARQELSGRQRWRGAGPPYRTCPS